MTDGLDWTDCPDGSTCLSVALAVGTALLVVAATFAGGGVATAAPDAGADAAAGVGPDVHVDASTQPDAPTDLGRATAGDSRALAQAGTAGVDLNCVGSGGGAAYVADSGLTVYENDSSVFFATFPASDTVRIGALNVSGAGDASARVEEAGTDRACLGDVSAATDPVTVDPDGAPAVVLASDLAGFSYRAPEFTGGDADLAYDASGGATVTIRSTGVVPGTEVVAADAVDGGELATGTVAANGSVTVDLPAGTERVDVRFERPLTVDAGRDRGVEPGERVYLVATTSGAVGTASYEWDVDGDGTTDATRRLTATRYDEAGTYAATVRVTDSQGRVATDSVRVDVADRRAPNVSAPRLSSDGRTLELSLTSDERLYAIEATLAGRSLAWIDFDERRIGPDDFRYVTTLTVASDGRYEATVRTAADASDNDGVDTLTVATTVDTASPVADAGPDRTVAVGDPVAFDGRNSTGEVADYSWAFGDGTTATGPTPTHGYDAPGTYRVRLTVTGADGGTDTDVATVTVRTGGDGPRTCDASVPGGAPARDIDRVGGCEDVDGDGDADLDDVTTLLFALSEFGADPAPATVDAFDFDGDGSIGFPDVITLLFEI